jgi:uncharacterized YigZ family protein
MSTRYPVPAAAHRAERVIERSRFIATVARAATVDEATAFVRAVSAEFPDATHNCWAYIAGAPGSTSRVGMSDDGEPHGTAGRPMLTVLLHSGVGEVAAVVTRYYGGTKLGTGGLARAYGGTLQDALATLPRAERMTRVALEVTVDYGAISTVQLLLPAHEGTIERTDYDAGVRYRVTVPDARVAEFEHALREATSGRAVVQPVPDDTAPA